MQLKKYSSTLVLAILLLLPLLSKAQENTFKINILSPIVRTLNVQFEHALSETSSIQIGAFYTGASVGDTQFAGFGLTPEYRFYLSESPAPQGVYVAPFARFQNFKLTTDIDDSEGKITTFGGGLIIGKQWIFKEKIVLDLFIGPQYNSGSAEVTSGSSSLDVGSADGFGVRAGLSLGIAF
jgi:hypothetical protein